MIALVFVLFFFFMFHCCKINYYRTPITLTDEEKVEHMRIGKEYNRQMHIRRNKIDKDLTDKIWLQQEALASLPQHLKELALIEDSGCPPPNRPWAFWSTPPIKDFKFSEYFKEEEETEI